MDYQALAELLFPDVTDTPEQLAKFKAQWQNEERMKNNG